MWHGFRRLVLLVRCCALLALAAASLAACGSSGRSVTSTPASSMTATPALPATVTGQPVLPQGGQATPVAPAGAGSGSWTTYAGNPARTGVAAHETAIGSPHRAWASPQLDGDIYAQPLILGGRVFVVTENDSVYALDEQRGTVVWRAHLGDPVPRSALPCGDIDPTGITGTPVIDPSSGLLYVVAFVQPGRHELVTLSVSDGAVHARRAIDPPAAHPLVEQQRGALALANGVVYVAYGGLFGDCGPYHGWVVGARADGSGDLLSYQVPSGGAAGIWAPAGPVVDGSGDLWVATGNSRSASTFDYGDSVIRLSPQLTLLDWFAPTDWIQLNQGDVDLGSVAPALLNDGLVFEIGKGGVGYLLRADHLGHLGGQGFQGDVCTGAYGGTAYQPPDLYVACSEGLVAVKVGPGESFSVAWRGPSSAPGTPIVAGGAVWVIDTRSGSLMALDAGTGAVRYRDHLGTVMHFVSSAAADGVIFAPAGRTVVATAMR